MTPKQLLLVVLAIACILFNAGCELIEGLRQTDPQYRNEKAEVKL